MAINRIGFDHQVRDLGFAKLNTKDLGDIDYCYKKNSKSGTTAEVIIDYSKFNSTISDGTKVKNIFTLDQTKESFASADKLPQELEQRINSYIQQVNKACKPETINGNANNKIVKEHWAMLQNIPKTLQKYLKENAIKNVDGVINAILEAPIYEYKKPSDSDIINHTQITHWRQHSHDTLAKAGFAIKKLIVKKADDWCVQLQLVVPNMANIYVGCDAEYSPEMNKILMEITLDEACQKRLNSDQTKDLVVAGRVANFIGYKGITELGAELEGHLATKEQLEEAGNGLQRVMARVIKEFRQDFIDCGYNVFKLKVFIDSQGSKWDKFTKFISNKKVWDMILLGLGKFIPDYLPFLRRTIPPESAGAVFIMLIPAVIVGFPFALINLVFRALKLIIGPITYSFFTLLAHPTFSAIAASNNKTWLRATGVLKWAIIVIFAVPVSFIMIVYKIAGCKLLTREVAREEGIDTDGVYTKLENNNIKMEKYNRSPILSKFLNVYKIVPTIGGFFVILFFVINFSNPLGLAIIFASLIALLITVLYRDIYDKKSNDLPFIVRDPDGHVKLNPNNRFACYIMAQMDQDLASKKSINIAQEDILESFLTAVSLNKNPEFIAAIGEFLEFYQILLSQMYLNDFTLFKEFFDIQDAQECKDFVHELTNFVDSLRHCVLRGKDQVTKYKYSEIQKQEKLDQKDKALVANIKSILAASYKDFEQNKPNVNFAIYPRAQFLFNHEPGDRFMFNNDDGDINNPGMKNYNNLASSQEKTAQADQFASFRDKFQTAKKLHERLVIKADN
jgi:hypothetical protein